MEQIESIKSIKAFQTINICIVVFLVNLRYVFIGLYSNEDSIIFTFLINVFLFLSIDNKILLKNKVLIIFSVYFLVNRISFISIIDFFLLGYALKRHNTTTILKLNIFFISFFLLLILLNVVLGYLPEKVFYVPKTDSIVYSLGFSHPNIFSLYAYALLLSIYLLFKNSFFLNVLLLISSWEIYKYSGSRTCLIGLCVLCCSDILLKLKLKCLLHDCIIICLPIFYIVITLFLLFNYQDYPLLDIILSGRLSIMGNCFSNVGLKEWILGFPVSSDMPCDSAYFTIFSYGGFFLLLYYLKVLTKSVKFLPMNKKRLVLISILTSGLTEYVFVGLNMISIILLCLLNNKFRDERDFYYNTSI